VTGSPVSLERTRRRCRPECAGRRRRRV